MLDFVKMALSEMPKYMLHLIAVTANPHQAVKTLKETEDPYLTRSWIFYGISLLFTEVIRLGQRSLRQTSGIDFITMLVYDAI